MMNKANSTEQSLVDLFSRALDLDDQQREQFLHELSLESLDKANELKALLAQHKKLTETRESELQQRFQQQKNTLEPGTIIGQYSLKSLIGSGGMSDVYLAETRDEEFKHQVAIKIIHAKSSTQISRFNIERQALASLKHPNITQIYDSGVTNQQQPYIVMEWVEGVSIDQWCLQHKVSIAVLLELFTQVCSAVNKAHQHFIIHRDIKPANVLISQNHNAKLLDFGIAKIIDPQQNNSLTVDGASPLTIAHAAPEQLDGGEISVATDIYGLGALLYSLLTGKPPEFERSQAAESEHSQLTLRAPSQLSQTKIPEDIEQLCLKCLAWNPDHRYSSMDALLADLQRYQSGEKLLGIQSSLKNRLIKNLRRNRMAYAISTVVLISTLLFAISNYQHNKRLQTEKTLAVHAQKQAEELSQIMLDSFADADPYQAGNNKVSARDVLEKAQSKLLANQTLDAEVLAPIMISLSKAYKGLLIDDKAQQSAQRAVELTEGFKKPNNKQKILQIEALLQAIESNSDASNLDTNTARIEKVSHLAQSTEIDADLQSRVYYYQGLVEGSATHWRKALAWYERALQTREGLDGDKNQLFTAEVLRKLARSRSAYRKNGIAVQLLNRELEIETKILGEDHYRVMVTKLEIVANIYMNPSEQDRAIQITKEVKNRVLKNYGPNSKLMIKINFFLSQFSQNSGNYEKAISYLQQNKEICKNLYTKNSTSYIFSTFNLAVTLLSFTNNQVETEAEFKEAIKAASQFWSPDNNNLNFIKLYYAYNLIELKKHTEATAILEELLLYFSTGIGEDTNNLALVQQALAFLYFKKKPNKSKVLYENSRKIVENNFKDNDVAMKIWKKNNVLFNK